MFFVNYEFLKVLLFILVDLLIVGFLILLPFLITSSSKKINKNTVYECGCDIFSSGFSKIEINFYLLAILFIIFEIELLFFFIFFLTLPLIIEFNINFVAIFLFYFFVLAGFIYEILRRGVTILDTNLYKKNDFF